jgi:putative transposase
MEVGELDHVHIFIKAHPKYAIGQIVKYIKGISGRLLFLKHPEIKQKLWKGKLWTHSYYVETIGSTNEENIRRYIQRQDKLPKDDSSRS